MKKLIPLLPIGLGCLSACKKENSEESPSMAWIAIRFHPTINRDDIQLNTNYTNIYSENFTFTTFRFYTGQYQLKARSQGTSQQVSGGRYWLADLKEPSTMSVEASLLPGSYNQLNFLLGVDSARNVSGVKAGDLDPVQGMFWTWNSGYIYFKFEGNATVSPEPNGKFEYHFGGFRYPNSAIRNFTAALTDPKFWDLSGGDTLQININIAPGQFFSAPYPLRISTTPVCTTPGPLAASIADNLAAAFQLTNVEIR